MSRNPSPLRRGGPTALALCGLTLGLASPSRAADGPCADRAARPAELVENARSAGHPFPAVELVRLRSRLEPGADHSLRGALNAGTLVGIDALAHRAFLRHAPKAFTLPLPAEGGVDLELVKVDIFTPDFTVLTSSGGGPVAVERGLHYRGVVRGQPGSLAAVSVFRNEVMGIYRLADDQPVVLGRLGGENTRGDHVLYAERDLREERERRPTCKMEPEVGPDGALPDTDEFLSFLAAQADESEPLLARCVRIYVEVNTDIYQNKGSVSAATSYITGVFNQSATLYSNDGIPISLSQVFVWNTSSPYTGTSSSTLLSQFQSYRNSFNGDLGHLVAFKGGGGIAAGFNGFCNSNIDNRQCFSGIQSTYSTVPTYSWTVEVFTHEMGHLMGSRHTHACVWNGNNTAIDGCYTPEGTCPRPGYPSNGGTIMSYCHLVSGVGINFNNGFGSQPGNVIRSRFNAASCLQDCGGGGGCTGTTYTGSLSGTGASQYQPNGSYYYSSISGTHSGTLSGPAGTDFDLYFQKWNGSAWATVASSLGSTSSESITYNGTAGYYRWRIYSYSGSGSYTLCARRP